MEMWPPNSDTEYSDTEYDDNLIWQHIIGNKIICSDCKNHDPRTFDFSVVEWSEMSIFIRCKKCQHKGEYHPSGDEIHTFKKVEKALASNGRYQKKNKSQGAETNWALEA